MSAIRPMRESQRKRLINKALRQGETKATAKIATILSRRYNHLKRELRRANLRKRLLKAQRDGKADGTTVDWATWIALLTDDIKAALASIAEEVYGVEQAYWLSRGKTLSPLDVAAVIAAYEQRVGRKISEIGDNTHSDILRDIIIWSATQETLPELIEELGKYFSLSRAENIARTESVGIGSQIAVDAMEHLGITGFNIDLAPEENGYPCQVCIDKADANPHALGDEMPPFHNYCRCGSSYLDNLLNA